MKIPTVATYRTDGTISYQYEDVDAKTIAEYLKKQFEGGNYGNQKTSAVS